MAMDVNNNKDYKDNNDSLSLIFYLFFVVYLYLVNCVCFALANDLPKLHPMGTLYPYKNLLNF